MFNIASDKHVAFSSDDRAAYLGVAEDYCVVSHLPRGDRQFINQRWAQRFTVHRILPPTDKPSFPIRASLASIPRSRTICRILFEQASSNSQGPWFFQ